MTSGKPDILIVGGDAMIGAASAAHLKDSGHRVYATTRRHASATGDNPYLDLSQPEPSNLPSADVVIIAAAIARLGDCDGWYIVFESVYGLFIERGRKKNDS